MVNMKWILHQSEPLTILKERENYQMGLIHIMDQWPVNLRLKSKAREKALTRATFHHKNKPLSNNLWVFSKSNCQISNTD